MKNINQFSSIFIHLLFCLISRDNLILLTHHHSKHTLLKISFTKLKHTHHTSIQTKGQLDSYSFEFFMKQFFFLLNDYHEIEGAVLLILTKGRKNTEVKNFSFEKQMCRF